jgi:SNF2 family DNA or RNA helicase
MVFQISATWTTHGTLFLSAVTSGMEVRGLHLASTLFTWDADSVYGTSFDETFHLGEPGIELTATEALRFFSAETMMNRAALLEWDIDMGVMKEVSQLLRTAMLERSLIPDFEQWKQGVQKWKLNQQTLGRLEAIVEEADPAMARWLMPTQGTSLVDEWLNQAILEAVKDQTEVAASLESTLQMYPRLTALPIHLFQDEQDWLTAVGFGQTDIPFEVCLELREPTAYVNNNGADHSYGVAVEDDGDLWKLQILLRDHAEPDRIYALPGQSDHGDEPCPESWMTQLDEVSRSVRIWQALCPWLLERDDAIAIGALDGDVGNDETPNLRTVFDGNGAWRFLTEVAPILVDAGYPVLAPSWWEEVRKRRARVKARVSSPTASGQKALFGLQQIVSFDWRVALGDIDVNEVDFERLLAQKQRLLRFQGRWIEIRPEFVEQFRKTTKAHRRKQGSTFSDVLELLLLGEQGDRASHTETGIDPGAQGEDQPSSPSAEESVDIELDSVLQSLLHALQNVGEMPVLDAPSGFVGQLRPYQHVGFSWLTFLRTYGLGACLADDMGLGKTVQYTAYLLQSRRESEGETLAGAPALLVCPTSVLGNWQKELGRFAPDLNVYLHYGANRKQGEAFAQAVADVDIVLTSYSLCHLDLETLQPMHWDSVCLDEAQNIKNPHTKQAVAIRQLSTAHRIAMTGTPVENRLTELWSIFEFINPSYLGRLGTFQNRFQKPIERDSDDDSIHQLKRLIGPFLLRRHKQDPAVELDLPEKMEAKAYVPLTREQAALYESVVQDMMNKLDTASAMERRGMILASLTKLKQVCNHPALFLKDGREQTTSGRSAKLDRLVEMVGELRSEGDSCLIFTQFVEAGRLLQQVLGTELSETALFLHGGLSKKARDQMVSEFQSGQGAGILLLSLRAGGVGLNLTAANHVFHYDRWWNPAVENQATDRAYRIGQNRRVQVHKFVTLGTLEERIDEMIEQKSAMSEQIVGAGEQWITEMSTGELRDLFQLRRDWGIDE